MTRVKRRCPLVEITVDKHFPLNNECIQLKIASTQPQTAHFIRNGTDKINRSIVQTSNDSKMLRKIILNISIDNIELAQIDTIDN